MSSIDRHREQSEAWTKDIVCPAGLVENPSKHSSSIPKDPAISKNVFLRGLNSSRVVEAIDILPSASSYPVFVACMSSHISADIARSACQALLSFCLVLLSFFLLRSCLHLFSRMLALRLEERAEEGGFGIQGHKNCVYLSVCLSILERFLPTRLFFPALRSNEERCFC